MKFQNCSIHGSKVNRCTDRQTDRQTDKPKAICPSNFFKVGGIKIIKSITFTCKQRIYTQYVLSQCKGIADIMTFSTNHIGESHVYL